MNTYQEPSHYYGIPIEKIGQHVIRLGYPNPKYPILPETKFNLVLRCEKCGDVWRYGSHKIIEGIPCGKV